MTSKLTRERIEQYANDPRMCNINDEIRELARIALAAMDSEPVGYFGRFDPDDEDLIDQCSKNVKGAFPLYRHAQLAPECQHQWKFGGANKLQNQKQCIKCGRVELDAQPAPEYPETLPCPVLLEPGMRFGKGVKTRLVLDAIQRRAEHYAELEAMKPEERAEYDANIEAFKAMLPQPAPIVPDGLIAAVNRLLDSDGSRGCYSAIRCHHARAEVERLLAAAPQETSVNDVTTGKPLTITLPDISSKAFWSAAGKNETFHPETYRRWVKEAVERACIIASIDVEVK